jgi:branched-subunit amino acid transport protein AzlD
MSVLIAVALVGAGSLLFRLAPLLGARRIPDRLTVLAGWAAQSVLVAMTVRSVVQHEDPAVPGAVLLAVASVGLGLLLAYRGRSALLAVAAGGATYVVLSAAVATVA